MVRKFKEKTCSMCGSIYTPTSPKQKYCVNCKSKADKIMQVKRDKKRNRLKYNVVYKKTCPCCDIVFTTYDSKKKYCGADVCELYRVRIKNKVVHKYCIKEKCNHTTIKNNKYINSVVLRINGSLSLSIASNTSPTKLNKLEYLTESRLGFYLETIFPKHVFINDKVLKGSGIRNRPDYYCKELALIVEFDGYRHFTDPKTILADDKKDVVYKSMGIKVVRIPYFIQLDTQTVYLFFKVKSWVSEDTVIYPHGFIDEKAATPAYFCSLGLKKYNYWKNLFKSGILGEWVYYRMFWYQHVVLRKDLFEIFPEDEVVSWKTIFVASNYTFPT